MRALATSLAILAAASAVLSVAACSGDKKQNIVYITPDAAPSGSTRPTGDGGYDCRAEDDQKSCGECCRDQHPKESDVYGTLVIKCFCQSDDYCKQQCKDSLCGTTNPAVTPGDPCDQCLTAKNADCASQVNPPCLNDPTCAPILQCFADAQCDQKPVL